MTRQEQETLMKWFHNQGRANQRAAEALYHHKRPIDMRALRLAYNSGRAAGFNRALGVAIRKIQSLKTED